MPVKDILFLFNNQLFSQVDGVGLGNPLGPTFANLFLCHHETNWLNNFKMSFLQLISITLGNNISKKDKEVQQEIDNARKDGDS